MYNVIFYDKVKEITTTENVTIRNYNDDGTYSDTIETQEVTKKYRVPTKFVFDTATNCDRMLYDFSVLDDFKADMPSLNSAISMFEGSSITSLEGAKGGSAEFISLTSADRMFKDCSELVSLNINAPSLVSAEEFVDNCTALQTVSGSLKNLVDGTNMFKSLSELNSFSASLESLENGSGMFAFTSLSTFSPSLLSLKTGTEMFMGSALNIFDKKLPSLITADSMFENCLNLTIVNIQCPVLETADKMFKGSSIESITLNAPKLTSAIDMFSDIVTEGAAHNNLISFNGNLSSLIYGDNMFADSALTTFNVTDLSNLKSAENMMGTVQFENWNIDLPSLESGYNMFSSRYVSEEETVYPALVSFESDLSALINGNNMFKDCINLKHFNAPLPSLENGFDMFTNCKLDAESAMFIAESLPYYPETEAQFITLGINCASSDADAFFASTGLYTNFNDFKQRLYDKGWNLMIVYNPE